jgi:prepilin-type N-terminal cleavage/methylation domain-containing protein
MRASRFHGRDDQAGMTLVEVMVAMVLVAILLVGMNALWVTISREVDSLVLRQKAIFRLNGEMERLVGLYSSSNAMATAVVNNPGVADFSTNVPANISSYISTTPNVEYATSNQRAQSAHSGSRLIYPDPTLTPLDYVTNSANLNGNFDEPAADSNKTLMSTVGNGNMDEILSRIFFWNTGIATPTGSNRNLVWIDRSKKIVGQISWSVVVYNTTGTPGGVGYYPCTASGGPCRHITLYLDYPFRFESLDSPRNEIDGLPVETITLQTIVAQR